ncbi:hypothetical protein RCCWILLIS_55 [Rhodobacter phage RcCWillis]|nr:hypothetical protein RCCWILLIS_55 [Rhodobacter phage RcCWillis]
MTITTHLSFQQPRDNGTTDAWAVEPTGNYADDCAKGTQFFAELRHRVDDTMNPLLISHTIVGMIEKGRVSGIEIGFLQSLSAQAV